MLAVAGEALRRQLGSDCNIFGGTAACKALLADSEFVKQCKGHNLEVGPMCDATQWHFGSLSCLCSWDVSRLEPGPCAVC